MQQMENGLPLGMEYSHTYIVTEQDTARVHGSGSLPVLATPRLVALLEGAAMACVASAVGPGATTVGVRIALDHLKASAVGSEIRLVARLHAVDGRKYSFVVEAASGDAVLARGVHDRFVVDAARFMERLGQ